MKAGKGLWPTRSTAGNFFKRRVGKHTFFGRQEGGGSKGINEKNRPQVVFKFLGPPCTRRPVWQAHGTWYNQECGDDEGNSSDDDDGIEDCKAIIMVSMKICMYNSEYCTISVNSAGHVMCYMPAKILTPAYGGNDHYMDFFSADNDTVKS